MYRIQKILSTLGILSRRECESKIKDGSIMVNNKVTLIGAKVKNGDRITYNNKNYIVNENIFLELDKILLYHKPCGEIVSRKDTHSRKTVFSNLPFVQGKWINIGRLDYNTSGLLLFTNNGNIANYLMHPSSNISRTYEVFIDSMLTDSEISKCVHGVDIGKSETGQFTHINKIYRKNEIKYLVTMNTGKNREIRRIFKTLKKRVIKLKRIEFSNIKLSGLKIGTHRYLTDKEKKLLRLPFD